MSRFGEAERVAPGTCLGGVHTVAEVCPLPFSRGEHGVGALGGNAFYPKMGARRMCSTGEPAPGTSSSIGFFESRWVWMAGTSVVTGASAAAVMGVARPGVWRPGCGVYRGLRLAWDVAGAGPEAVRPGRATSFGAFATGGGLGRRVIPFPFTSTFAVG